MDKYRRIFLFIGLPVFFMASPFCAFILALIFLFCKNWSRREYLFIFGILAAYGALLAFTQKTDTGDIGRVYAGIVQSSDDISFLSAVLISLVESKYILFACVNVGVFKLLGNVQFISLVWIFVFYMSLFAGILNMLEYKKMNIDHRIIRLMICTSIFCFVIFTQITEIMKQSVAISLCFYAYSCYLLKYTRRACAIFCLSLGIHFSPLFLFPILLAKRFSGRMVWCIVLGSFFLRRFNLMNFVNVLLGKIGGFNTLMELSDSYQTNDADFYQSSSLYFVVSFGFLFLISTCVYQMIRSKDTTLIKSVLLMIAILNLNYENAHNFTRLVTSLFPFYCMLMIDILNSNVRTQIRTLVGSCLIVGSFILNYQLMAGRLSAHSSYATAYMDNSLFLIATSSLPGYLEYKF